MNLIKGEFSKILFTYIKSKKSALLSILLFVIILGISLNIYENRFAELGEISSLIIGSIFLIRIMLSSLMFPTSQLSEAINKNNVDSLIGITNYSLEMTLLVRSIFTLIFNVCISLFFIFLIHFVAPISLEKNLIIYLMLLAIVVIGSFSIIGIGFIVVSLVWKFNVKLPIVILSQLLFVLLIFTSPYESFLIPFSDSKLFVINVFNGYNPTFLFFLKKIIIILFNSIIYLIIGYIFLKLTRYDFTKNKIKGWKK
jgi:hypothetical protein